MSDRNAFRPHAASRSIGFGLVLAAAFFIGIMPNAAKLAYGAGANPIAVLFVRAATAILGLGTFLLLRRERVAIPHPSSAQPRSRVWRCSSPPAVAWARWPSST